MDAKTAKELAAIVAAHAEDVRSEHEISISDLPTEFCALWPKAKPVLSFIAQAVVYIPGVGTMAGAVLGGLLKVGDEISAGICK